MMERKTDRKENGKEGRKEEKKFSQGHIAQIFAAALFFTCLAIMHGSENAWAQQEGILSPEPDNKVQDERILSPGWIRQGESWYWMGQDGVFHKGWLFLDGRYYFLDETGAMVTGWYPVEDSWYYFHEDGGMNLGELILGDGTYEFTPDGQLVFAQRTGGTGGGTYEAACYNEEEQELFDWLNEEKKERYFEEHPEREERESGRMGYSYDRYASFSMDMALNRAAAHRLKAAMQQGYADGRIPGEGNINDYLAAIPYRKNASCLELYVRDCQDAEEAFDKIREKTGRLFDSREDRKYSLTYYRYLGMDHEERDGKHYFTVILMR